MARMDLLTALVDKGLRREPPTRGYAASGSAAG
jgi:hypothetical protein